eukprot:scaffold2636_cov340-Pavlova_lutheri.AAC.79
MTNVSRKTTSDSTAWIERRRRGAHTRERERRRAGTWLETEDACPSDRAGNERTGVTRWRGSKDARHGWEADAWQTDARAWTGGVSRDQEGDGGRWSEREALVVSSFDGHRRGRQQEQPNPSGKSPQGVQPIVPSLVSFRTEGAHRRWKQKELAAP